MFECLSVDHTLTYDAVLIEQPADEQGYETKTDILHPEDKGVGTPPKGVIDGSVLTASGELLLFPTLLYAFRALELGYKVKFQKGETSIEFNQHDEK